MFHSFLKIFKSKRRNNNKDFFTKFELLLVVKEVKMLRMIVKKNPVDGCMIFH